VDVGAPLVADGKAAEAVEPGERALDHPAVPAQTFAAVHPTPGDAGPNGAGAAFPAAPTVVIGLVGVERLGSPPGSSPTVTDARDGVQGGRQHHAVMAIGGAQTHPEGRAAAVDHKVALRARFAAIRRVRAGLGAPLFAATAALSSAARLQSRCPASERRSSSTR
jgi:hypothetical protein